MRTKTLLIAAAALAAGVFASQAQSNVYSANVVGYINLNLVGANGYTLIANQLDLDGNKTNNNVVTVFGTNLPVNTTVLAWVPGSQGYTSASWINSKGVLKWSGDTNGVNTALSSGGGVFVQAPSADTNTIVGNVIQGTNITTLVSGYNMVSADPALSGGISSNLGYVPTVGDTVLTWDPVAQGYVNYNYISSKGVPKWSPSEPVLSVGQAVFIQTTATPGWTNTFTVH